MLLDAPRRYCRNLTGFIISKPPCVVFTVCLCCLAIALFWLGYYVNNNEVVDPEAEKVSKVQMKKIVDKSSGKYKAWLNPIQLWTKVVHYTDYSFLSSKTDKDLFWNFPELKSSCSNEFILEILHSFNITKPAQKVKHGITRHVY